jgi:adenylosuccinate synthase
VPARAANYARCKPILKRVKAIPHVDWRGLAAKHKGVAALPAEARAYLRQIELFAGAPVTLVGVGPGREDVLTARRGPRRRAKH